MTDEVASTLESIDIKRIMALLPHRYPFLLIDRIIDMVGDTSGTGIKNVTINEPFFAGHFPGEPVMPGVLLIEAMAQTAGALVLHHHGVEASPVVYFLSIEKARFRKPVLPGHVVHLPVRKVHNRRTIYKFAAEARVDGVVHAEAEVSAMLGASS